MYDFISGIFCYFFFCYGIRIHWEWFISFVMLYELFASYAIQFDLKVLYNGLFVSGSVFNHFLLSSVLLSLFFSKLPLSVGSGRRRLKNPNFHRQYVNKASNSSPPTMDTIIIQSGTSPSPGCSWRSGYANVVTCKSNEEKSGFQWFFGAKFRIISK